MRDFLAAVTLNAPAKLEADLINLGFDNYQYKLLPGLPNHADYHKISLQIYLDDPRIDEIHALVQRYELISSIATEFTKKDFDSAEWFEVHAISWLNYPKPETTWKQLTYDLAAPDYCHGCNGGLKQKAPFQLGSSEPKATTKSFFSPGWVHDEIFVRTEVQNVLDAESITGIDYLFPLKAQSKQPFDNLVQIVVKSYLPFALANGQDLNPRPCKLCGNAIFGAGTGKRVKKFERAMFANQPDIVKTSERFGKRKLLLISRKFYQLIIKHKWKGLEIRPVVLVAPL